MKNIWFCGSGMGMVLVLMALPCSVNCGSGEELTSYFSLLPISQGNWFPALAVVFAVLALIFMLREQLRPMLPVCLSLSAAVQLLSYPMFGSLTVVGAVAAALQVAVLCAAVQTDLPAKGET